MNSISSHGTRRRLSAFLLFPFLVLPLLLFADSSGAIRPAQQTKPTTTQALPADTDTLKFVVTVLNARSGFVVGLTKDDFSVWEGKTRREINYFSNDDLPLSVVVLMDVSGSVVRRELDLAKYAAAQFVKLSHPANEYFVGEFNHERSSGQVEQSQNQSDADKGVDQRLDRAQPRRIFLARYRTHAVRFSQTRQPARFVNSLTFVKLYRPLFGSNQRASASPCVV